MRYVFVLFFLATSMAWSQKETKELPFFHSLSGLGARDMLPSEMPHWGDVESNVGGEALKIESQVVQSLNISAQEIWAKLSICYDGNINELRGDYLNLRIKCGRSQLARLHQNVRNWLETTTLEGIGIDHHTMMGRPTFVPLHPLLGQVLVEAHVSYKKATAKALDENAGPLTGTHYIGVDRFKRQCATKEISEKECHEKLPLLNGYDLSARMIASSPRYCYNFGLWPHAALFVFSQAFSVEHGFIVDILSEIDLTIKMSPLHSKKEYLEPYVREKYAQQPGFDIPSSCWQDTKSLVVPRIRFTSQSFAELKQQHRFLNGFIDTYEGLHKFYSSFEEGK